MKPYYQDEHCTIYNADCLAVLGALRADAIVTDPPYALNYTSDTGGKISGDKVRDFRRMLLKLPKALAHTNANTMALFTRWDIWRDVHSAFDALWPPCACAVWDKDNLGRGNCNHVGQAHELIYLSAPAQHMMRVAGRRVHNIIRHAIVPPGKMLHPTEKPVGVMRWLCEAMCPEGGTVLDPFMGSGTTGAACIRTGRGFVGIEKDPHYFEIARKRLERELSQIQSTFDFGGGAVAPTLNTKGEERGARQEAGNSLPQPLCSPAILFRCLFCGLEFRSVEECNACEAKH